MQYKKRHIVRIVRWFERFRHRCGYEIHSPFAFEFVNDVVYSPGIFYACTSLERLLRDNPENFLRLKDILMLFRLANFVRPETCKLVNIELDSIIAKAISAGSKQTVFSLDNNVPSSLTIAYKWENIAANLIEQLPSESVLLFIGIDNTQPQRKIWRKTIGHKNARITFDLGDFGIIFNKKNFFPQEYIINYY